MNGLNQALDKFWPQRRATLTSSATCAIYLLLKHLKEKNKWDKPDILLPSTLCPSVLFAVQWAGFNAVFCDAELETFCVSPASVRAAITPESKVLLLAYMFGKAIDGNQFRKLCLEQNLLLIEDLAQAVGGLWQGQRLGTFADYTILSFNEKKILKTVNGGAILCLDPGEAQTLDKAEALLPSDDSLSRRAHWPAYQDLQRGLITWHRMTHLEKSCPFPPHVALSLQSLFLYRKTWSLEEQARLALEIAKLDEVRSFRYHRYDCYSKGLKNHLEYVRFSSEDMCWRLPLLLPRPQDQMACIEEFRVRNLLISDHYFPLSTLMGDRSCRNSEEIGLRAVNLWVDEKLQISDLPWMCARLNQVKEGV